MTDKSDPDFLKLVGQFVEMRVQLAVKAAVQRIAALETRSAELEEGGVRYCGVHQRALAYKRGSMVTSGGGVFIAVTDVPPGELPAKSVNWQLAVKPGRDAA